MTTPPPPPPPPAGAPPELEAQPEAQPDPQPEASDESPLRRLHPIDLKFEAKIGRATAMFIVPKNRPSLAYDLAMGTGVNKLFAYAAAIGVFWFGPKPPAAKRPYTNAVLWGQAVADETPVPVDSRHIIGLHAWGILARSDGAIRRTPSNRFARCSGDGPSKPAVPCHRMVL